MLSDFHRIGRVDNLADFRREGKEWDDASPVAAPKGASPGWGKELHAGKHHRNGFLVTTRDQFVATTVGDGRLSLQPDTRLQARVYFYEPAK